MKRAWPTADRLWLAQRLSLILSEAEVKLASISVSRERGAGGFPVDRFSPPRGEFQFLAESCMFDL